MKPAIDRRGCIGTARDATAGRLAVQVKRPGSRLGRLGLAIGSVKRTAKQFRASLQRVNHGVAVGIRNMHQTVRLVFELWVRACFLNIMNPAAWRYEACYCERNKSKLKTEYQCTDLNGLVQLDFCHTLSIIWLFVISVSYKMRQTFTQHCENRFWSTARNSCHISCPIVCVQANRDCLAKSDSRAEVAFGSSGTHHGKL
jgi:hypothetical protein